MGESLLYLARKRAGLTQAQAAREWAKQWPDTPRERKAWSAWEAWPGPSGREPTMDVYRKLAKLYGCRVSELVDPDAPVRYETAIAIVVHEGKVLLVNRRDTGNWQFVGGTVKPGADPERVAVREVRDECEIEAVSRGRLGERLHPKTRTWCYYFACDYLAGEARNGDPDENTAVVWAPIEKLTEFVPADVVFGPALDYLGAARV